MDAQWNVLIVRPKSERKVGVQLSNLGFETCVPVQKQLRYWSDRKKIVERVLFNNYVFVETSLKRKGEVFKVANVIKYLNYLRKPAILKSEEVSLIKQLSGLQDRIKITYDKFNIGELVEIISGPLMGQKGNVVGINGSEQIQLSIPNLNCFANLELSGEEIKHIKN